MTFKELFPRRKCHGDSIEGPRGQIQFKYGQDDEPVKLWVVVDIHNRRVQHTVEKILNDPKYTLCENGEYCFDLDFSDVNRALALVGLRSKGQRE